MQKTIFVLPTFQAGGAERVMLTLFNGYNDATAELIVLDGSGVLGRWLNPGAAVTDLHARGTIRGLWRLLRALRAKRPDVIISTMARMNFILLLLKPFLWGAPKIIVREASIPSRVIRHTRFKRIASCLYRFLYPSADVILAPSRRIVDDFSRSLGMDTARCRVLYNPVDVDRIRACAARGFLAHTDQGLHFVCVGRLIHAKGFDRLIDALPAFSPACTWSLTIIGEGCERKALESLIATHHLQGRVTLAGFQENPWSLMAAADAVLLPSRWEGLPNIVLESLALGTPVIALESAGGIAEIAAQAPDHVAVAQTMDDFLSLMRQVAPCAHTQIRHSAVPMPFHPAYALAQFRALVDALSA